MGALSKAIMYRMDNRLNIQADPNQRMRTSHNRLADRCGGKGYSNGTIYNLNNLHHSMLLIEPNISLGFYTATTFEIVVPVQENWVPVNVVLAHVHIVIGVHVHDICDVTSKPGNVPHIGRVCHQDLVRMQGLHVNRGVLPIASTSPLKTRILILRKIIIMERYTVFIQLVSTV